MSAHAAVAVVNFNERAYSLTRFLFGRQKKKVTQFHIYCQILQMTKHSLTGCMLPFPSSYYTHVMALVLFSLSLLPIFLSVFQAGLLILVMFLRGSLMEYCIETSTLVSTFTFRLLH